VNRFRAVGGRNLPFPILKASGLYNSLYYRTSRDVLLGSYRELHDWSANNYAEFWEECFHFFDIRHSVPYSQV